MNWYTGSSAGERWRITLITRNSVLRREEEPRLEMLRLRISIWPDWYGGASMPAKATSAGVKAAHVADLRHELGAESRANTEHPHHNRVLRQRCRQGLHFVSERGQCGRNGPELGHRLLYQKFGSIGSGHDAEMPTGEGVDVNFRLVYHNSHHFSITNHQRISKHQPRSRQTGGSVFHYNCRQNRLSSAGGRRRREPERGQGARVTGLRSEARECYSSRLRWTAGVRGGVSIGSGSFVLINYLLQRK